MANDSRIIKTGLFGKKNKDILDSVIGQWSDGIWENNPQMAKYWKFADVAMPNGEVLLEIDNEPSSRDGRIVYNAFLNLDDAKVKEIFGRYVKAIVKEEIDDGMSGEWKRDCTSECDYLTRSDDEPITVKDAYYAYEVLKGRNVNKHPEYSEAFYAQKDDKDYQIEIELEDGPNAEDPEKLTVVVDGKKETVDVPKDGTEDHYRKAIDAGLKKLGYKMVEGKIPDANEGKYPKKCESDGWAGWEDVTDLESTIDKIEQLAYELRSCVRGAYTRCNTWAELSEYIKSLASDLEAAGDNVSWKNDEEDD